MEPKFMISEVFGTSWKYTKSQIWVLVGLFIGYFILSSIISLFGMPAQGSMVCSRQWMEKNHSFPHTGSNPVKSSLILLPVSLWGSQWLSEYSY